MNRDDVSRERINAPSGQLRSGLGSGEASRLFTKTDIEMAAPVRIGPPHAPAPPNLGDTSANGSAANDSIQGDQAPLFT